MLLTKPTLQDSAIGGDCKTLFLIATFRNMYYPSSDFISEMYKHSHFAFTEFPFTSTNMITYNDFLSEYMLTIYKLTWIRNDARLFPHVANVSFSLLYVQIICQPTFNPNASSNFFLADFVPAIIQLYFSRVHFVCTYTRRIE